MNSALVAAAATGVQIGAAMVASEVIVAQVGAGTLGFLRYLIGVLFLFPILLRSGIRPIAKRDILPVMALGIGQFGILIALLNVAVLYSTSARASIIFATLPLMTIVVTWLFFRTAITLKIVASISLTIVGVAVLLGGDAITGHAGTYESIGLGCAFLATAIGAICSAFYRPYVSKYGVLSIGVIAMAASLIPLGVISFFEAKWDQVFVWTSDVWLLIAFVGLSSGIGYLMWLYALLKAPAGIATAFLALSPITSVLLSLLILGGEFPQSLFLALCLIVAGLLVLSMRSSADSIVDPKSKIEERTYHVN